VGLFSWLFGKRSRVPARDFTWLTDAARIAGAVESVREDTAAGKPVLVVAQFPSTLAAFRGLATNAGLPAVDLPPKTTPAQVIALAAGPPRVLLALARHLTPDEFPSADAAPSPLPVLVLERHFLREHDDRVVRFAEGLGTGAAVSFHLSLDDPMMKLLLGEWVRNTLRTLGMEENEPLDSAIVTRRAAAAQAKFARTVPSDHEADSPAAWVERNQAG
jgi:preprotein translocase subunit SecA